MQKLLLNIQLPASSLGLPAQPCPGEMNFMPSSLACSSYWRSKAAVSPLCAGVRSVDVS